MKRFVPLLVTVLLLTGCAAPVAVTTEPQAPPSTALPSEVTIPSETTVPLEPVKTDIRAVVDAFLTAYEENCYLYTDNEYDHLTVLAANPDATVTYLGESIPLSDFHENIQTLHDTEAYWKQSRQEQGIYRHNFETQCHFTGITIDGDTATVLVDFAMSFSYDDSPGSTSGGRDAFELLLVQVDGTWLIANVSEIGA